MRPERCEKARANSRVTKAAFWALMGLATSMSLGAVELSQSTPVEGRAPGSGIRSGLHAGTVRASSGCARRCASGSRHYSRARSPTACLGSHR